MQTISDYEPEFTPVALDRVRHDGWTPERQRLFLIALAALGTVDSAAQAVGMSRISAYNLKKRADAGSFADEWDRALGFGRDMMFDYALERAIYGVTSIKMRLGGAFEFQTGPDDKHLMKVMRVPPPRRDAKARLPAS
ncbi:hypothetical protein [Sphingorhabdus wooponensis]|jgi:hypothetical protein|uniref:LysR family transcriptional regulator n=1 Tax=Sphingorhabdus wooponensis TaxID=940136 RepID=A0A426RUX4_9SPHN|nr:hypothetical protein [Sphingorhabdus wooponensis]RRQ52711.1 hypothetical protein D7D48_07770 [Sphingorhabdus wooponensis]